MDKISEIEIQCLNCKGWIPSPIFFGDMDSLLSNLTVITGNKVSCKHCGKFTSCNRENMRVKSEDGGFRGLDTV